MKTIVYSLFIASVVLLSACARSPSYFLVPDTIKEVERICSDNGGVKSVYVTNSVYFSDSGHMTHVSFTCGNSLTGSRSVKGDWNVR